jgi:hypothetical protein
MLTGRNLPGGFCPQETGPVKYVDWETRHEEVGRRLYWLARGVGIPVPAIAYRRQAQTIIKDIREVGRLVQRIQPAFVIIDSAFGAVGGEAKEAQPFTDFYGVPWRLNATSLVLSQISREGADDPKKANSYFHAAWPTRCLEPAKVVWGCVCPKAILPYVAGKSDTTSVCP